METKICCTCKQELPVTEFNKKTSRRFQSSCKKCHKEYRRSHYLKNRQKYIEKAARWTAEFSRWWKEFKSKFKCVECGESHPACLDFHHIDDTKEACVSFLVRQGNKNRVLKEIEKCIVLCSNCHRKLHWNENAAIV